jgi:hypothetical protein
MASNPSPSSGSPWHRSIRRIWIFVAHGHDWAQRERRMDVPLVLTLALLQLWLLQNTTPPADGISYFEVADQIQRVGHGQALPQHCSPLYPLYLLAIRTVAPAPLDRELLVTAAGDTLASRHVVRRGHAVLAICHRDSSITRVVEQTGAGLCITFADPLGLSSRAGEIASAIESLAGRPRRKPDAAAIEPFTARASTAGPARVLDHVADRPALAEAI